MQQRVRLHAQVPVPVPEHTSQTDANGGLALASLDSRSTLTLHAHSRLLLLWWRKAREVILLRITSHLPLFRVAVVIMTAARKGSAIALASEAPLAEPILK